MSRPSPHRVRARPAASAPRQARGGLGWRQAGFTLIELMVVVVLIGIASAVASLALRDPASTRLEHEAARLVALLEAARTEARASGLAVYWVPGAAGPTTGAPRAATAGTAASPGFRFVGLPASSDLPSNWLTTGVTAEVIGAPVVTLGPEPLIGAQRIVLHLDQQSITITTDGLGPFAVNAAPATAIS